MYTTLQDIVLEFSPGPIHAVDGDTGVNSSISYAILSGIIHDKIGLNLRCADVTLAIL